MAEANLNDLAGVGRDGDGAGLSYYINSFGALLSLAMIAGIVSWGYQLAVRDVTGVPVIRALDGPMRVQPENPGGLASDHQGLAVNRVQAEGQAGKPADQLTLAPTPVSLTDEDLALIEIEAEEAAVPTASVEIAQALSEVTGDAEIRTDADLAVAAALAQDLLEDEITIEAVRDASDTLADPLDDMPGPKTAVRPALRPKFVAVPGTVIDVDPADIPLGTRLVQLGAFASEDDARAEWARLAEGFEAFVGDKKRIIQRTESSGRIFYRLRAVGFTDLADARRFCAAILASEASCIPVLTR